MSESSAEEQVQQWLNDFSSALQSGDSAAAANLFEEEGFWRDLVSFTWNIKTLEGRAAIQAMLDSCNANTQPSNSLKGHEAPEGSMREMGVEHGESTGRKNWAEKRQHEAETLGYDEQPYCLIVGGGQGGIALGARMRMLGVPTIIIEKNERAGDSWRKRYKSLCLHDPVWYDHLPYIPFPKHWPVFAPKDKLGDWLEMYTKIMELNYWGSTVCKSASFDESANEWTVEVEREGKAVTLKPKQLVLATGMSAKPNIPEFPGQENFTGEIQHSSQHPGPDAYKDKKVVVIGSNNSSHDICAALVEQGGDVTMVQRSSTHIAKSDTLMELALGGLYSEDAVANGIDHHKADLVFASVPYKIMHAFHIPVYEEMAKRDKDLYDRLESAGFMLDFGEDGSGLFMKYLRRGSGYYIDVGASEMVANGKIKLKSGVAVKEITANGVTFDDGSELAADLIVMATGYSSMNGWAADLISQDVADKVGKCWGLGSDTIKDPGPWEGELRNMWKPVQQDGLWFHGGNLHQSRHYSQFLSLQIKARMEGIDTPVYELAPVHHVA